MWNRDEYRDRLTGAIVAIEITPINDTRPHISEPDCDCLPELSRQGNASLLCHNAFDGREWSEPNWKGQGH
jgi:hypothetical protein